MPSRGKMSLTAARAGATTRSHSVAMMAANRGIVPAGSRIVTLCGYARMREDMQTEPIPGKAFALHALPDRSRLQQGAISAMTSAPTAALSGNSEGAAVETGRTGVSHHRQGRLAEAERG